MNTFISGYRKRQREPSIVVADQDYLQTVQLQLPGDRVDHGYADRHRDVAVASRPRDPPLAAFGARKLILTEQP
jgi:hypothetical protein